MKILQIGAGYVGSALLPALLQKHQVAVIDNGWFGTSDEVAIRAANSHFIRGEADSLDTADLISYDVVIFLAGLSNDPMADHDPRENFRANAALPAYLAYIAANAGVKKFIHSGSCSVYGNQPGTSTDETSPGAFYPYGVAKHMAEVGCLAQQERMSVVSFRKGTICGVSPRMRFDLVINRMALDAVRTGTITVNATDTMRPILGIQDAVSAYVRAVELPCSGIFNLHSFNTRIGDLAEIVRHAVASVTGGRISINDLQGNDLRSYSADSNKAKRLLGWRPEASAWNIATEVAQYILGSSEDFDDPKFYNIATFKALDSRVL